MKRILKSLSILFIALMMVSCSDEAQSITSGSGSGGTQGPSDPSGGTQGPSGGTQGPSDPSDETQYPSGDSFDNVIEPDREVEGDVGDGIPPESGFYEGNGYTIYYKSADSDDTYSYSSIPMVLTVGKNQIKLSIDRDSIGEYISGVEGVPLFPRGLNFPELFELDFLDPKSIQNYFDLYCFGLYLNENYPLAMYPSETKTVKIESVSGLESIKDDPEVSIEVKWCVANNNVQYYGNVEYTTAKDGTISSITLKKVPVMVDYLTIIVIAKKGDSSTIYEARIDDLYHPTNRDEVYEDATVESASFGPSEYFGPTRDTEIIGKDQLVSLNGRYVTDQADSPYYEITFGVLNEFIETATGPNGTSDYWKGERSSVFRLKKDATNGNLILSEMYDSEEDGTYDKEEKIGEFIKK